MSVFLDVDQISLHYDQQCILNHVSFALGEGEFGALLGSSGCGKTSLLRAIAGFNKIDSGSIALSGRCVSSHDIMVPAEERDIGMVFQDYALFPHLNVLKNVSFGLSRVGDKAQVYRLIELLELTGLEDRYPHQLSGGQQQRVALARALAPQPHFILLDEPFSNLDVHLRERLAFDLRQLLKEQGITAMLVTHDQDEAFAFADKIAVLHDGEIEQVGTAQSLYQHPVTPFVANFIGDGTVFDSSKKSHQDYLAALGYSHESISNLPFVLLRPNELSISSTGKGVRVKLISSLYREGQFLCTALLENKTEVIEDKTEVIFYHDQNCTNLIGQYLFLDRK